MNKLSPELYWAVLTAGLTAILWVPHVIQRILEMGLVKGFSDPTHHIATKAAWAQRAIRAHTNAIENLVVFGIFALAIQITGKGTDHTSLAAEVFFLSRIVHYVTYVLAIPYARAVSFIVGFVCQVTLFCAIV